MLQSCLVVSGGRDEMAHRLLLKLPHFSHASLLRIVVIVRVLLLVCVVCATGSVEVFGLIRENSHNSVINIIAKFCVQLIV